MKAYFLLEQDADVSAITTEAQRALLTPVTRVLKGVPKIVWTYKKGQVVEGELARHIISSGQGAPLDDESAAEVGLTPEQLKRRQIDYEMTSKGIHKPEDRELYLAGVILGYDDQLNYLHGPNWDSYQATLKKDDEDEDE